MLLLFHCRYRYFCFTQVVLKRFCPMRQNKHSRSYFAFRQTWSVELVTWQVWNAWLAQLIVMSVTCITFSNTSQYIYIYIQYIITLLQQYRRIGTIAHNATLQCINQLTRCFRVMLRHVFIRRSYCVQQSYCKSRVQANPQRQTCVAYKYSLVPLLRCTHISRVGKQQCATHY